jgi:hypothetical protein
MMVVGGFEATEHHALAVDAAAKFYEAAAQKLSDGRTVPPVLIVDRDRGKLEARAYVRMMEAWMREIFSTPLYGTLAAVTNVALDLHGDEKVNREMVIKWCTNKNT